VPKGNKRTKKQHYIPQVYLRGFSPDYKDRNIENIKYKIYRYELNEKSFFKKFKAGDNDVAVFYALFEPMKNMSFGVGVDPDGRIITSDMVVFIQSAVFPCAEYEKVIFPITSKLCLYMFGGNEKKDVRKNFLFKINDRHREEILKSISVSAFENIYSSHILDETERKYIKEIIKETAT